VQQIDHANLNHHETCFPYYMDELVQDEHPTEILLQQELLVHTKTLSSL
jgi:hypothetical protein